MSQTTLIKGADWVIAWDAATSRHVYRRGIDVVFTEDRILHVGPGFAGIADQTLDGRGLMVMPGLVDVHSHLGFGLDQHQKAMTAARATAEA